MSIATTSSNALESLVIILLLAMVHLGVKQMQRLREAVRNALLSAGAGASLAYVLVRILPKLAEKQESLMASADTGLRGFLEHHAYLVAMAGLVVYYGLSRIAAYGAQAGGLRASPRYRATIVAIAVGHGAYSFLIGYLIVNRLHMGLFSQTLITFGMGTLFMVSDYGLRQKWGDAYDSWIRWVLALALLGGWALGAWIEVSPNVVALWYAFLAGIMLIITIGEKLSIEQSGSFWPFLAGVLTFTLLLLILERLSRAPLP